MCRGHNKILHTVLHTCTPLPFVSQSKSGRTHVGIHGVTSGLSAPALAALMVHQVSKRTLNTTEFRDRLEETDRLRARVVCGHVNHHQPNSTPSRASLSGLVSRDEIAPIPPAFLPRGNLFGDDDVEYTFVRVPVPKLCSRVRCGSMVDFRGGSRWVAVGSCLVNSK